MNNISYKKGNRQPECKEKIVKKERFSWIKDGNDIKKHTPSPLGGILRYQEPDIPFHL